MLLRRGTRMFLGTALAVTILMAAAAASAQASAQIRLVNAQGGSDAATLVVSVGGQRTDAGGSIPYGAASELVDVPAGAAKLSLTGNGGKTRTKTTPVGARTNAG